ALRPRVDVLKARDGLDGYHLACSARIDVILLDILMPIVDGWTVCRKLRANPITAHLPIIVITSLEPEAITADAAGLRIAQIVYRPCSSSEIWGGGASVLGIGGAWRGAGGWRT